MNIKPNLVKNKSIKQRIWIGIKEAWDIELLPSFIVNFENKTSVKIAKLIGGMSMFLIISDLAHKLNIFLYYITFLISLVYILYRIYLAFYAIIGYINIIRKGKFIVRKSPTPSS